jgi:hypothetical protein
MTAKEFIENRYGVETWKILRDLDEEDIWNLIQEYHKLNPSILDTIKKEYKRKEAKGWDKVYLFLDLHETVIYPDYNNKEPIKFYEHAKECLQFLSTIKEIELGFYTCSYPEEIEKYKKYFEEIDIKIIHINKNEDVSDTRYGYYKDKPYFSLVFENKAGFNAENDWLPVFNWFKEKYSGLFMQD